MGRGVTSASGISHATSGEDLAEAFETGHGSGCQEVVDVRIGGAHPGGERLIAGGPGEWIQPHESVAVATQSGRLDLDDSRIASIPAVRHDDDHAA